jgi:hypothetical protein
MGVADPCLSRQPESFFVGQAMPALHLITVSALDRQAFAASRAAGFQHVAPPDCAHAREEAMHTTAAAALGLISSFSCHAFILLP